MDSIDKDQRQAGDSTEIEITPEMIGAGVSVLRNSGLLLEGAQIWEVEELTRDIFLAMRRLVDPNPQSVRSVQQGDGSSSRRS